MTGHSRRRLRAIAGRLADEAGTSLVELMIVTVILSLVLGVAMNGLMSAQRADQGNVERVGNLDQARLLMDNTDRDLRTAVRLVAGGLTFTFAGPREVIFTSTLDQTTNVPVQVHLYVDPTSELIEQTRPPDVGSVAPAYTYSGAWKTRYVARYINNTASQPIFNFCDGSANPCTAAAPSIPFPGPANAPTPLVTVGVAAPALAIHALVLYFSVRHSTVYTVNATVLTTRVRLPNLDYNGLGGL